MNLWRLCIINCRQRLYCKKPCKWENVKKINNKQSAKRDHSACSKKIYLHEMSYMWEKIKSRMMKIYIQYTFKIKVLYLHFPPPGWFGSCCKRANYLFPSYNENICSYKFIQWVLYNCLIKTLFQNLPYREKVEFCQLNGTVRHNVLIHLSTFIRSFDDILTWKSVSQEASTYKLHHNKTSLFQTLQRWCIFKDLFLSTSNWGIAQITNWAKTQNTHWCIVLHDVLGYFLRC